MKRILITGAGGFIGSHLAQRLHEDGNFVIGVDLKESEFGPTAADGFVIHDLRNPDKGLVELMADVDEVYALAADMGGMGYISCHHAEILRNNLLINLNTLETARQAAVSRYLFSSSACVYPEFLQERTDVVGLKESDAYPAQPQDAYGWEKLTTEKLCEHYRADYGMDIKTVRFHNIFGPRGTWQGGREKAPAAMCRKIADAKLRGLHQIEVWGDGEQTRSFCYVDDCTRGLAMLMESDLAGPINLGQDRMVSINELADIIMGIADWHVAKRFIDGPQGVRGRNSDNTLVREKLGWEPAVSLEQGLATTYHWIEEQVRQSCP